MDDDFVEETFVSGIVESKDLIRKRQDVRSAKEGDVSITGTIESYLTKYTENGQTRNSNTAAPPKTEMKETKDKKKRYPAAIPMNVRISSVSIVPGQSEKQEDKEGWRIRSSLFFFDDAKTFLQNPKNLEAIYSDEATDELKRMREYVQPDGKLAEAKWLSITPGDQVKVKVPDGADNIFRQMNPNKPSMLLVQPSTPVKFMRIIAEIYVNIKTNIVDDNDGTTKPAESEAEVKEVETDAAAESGKRSVKVLVAYTAYNCKGGTVISEDYDPDLAQSERLHELGNPYAHNMVPIADVRDKKASAPKSAYFYVKRRMQTPVSADTPIGTPGITLLRDTTPDMKDYMSEYQDQKKPTCVVRFFVYQWFVGDEDKTKNMYVVKVICSGDDQWRNFGITSLEPYGMIVKANPDLPLHLQTTLWEGATLKHDSNDPKIINNKPEVANVKGYYIYGGSVVPDFLRHFRTSGMRLSAEYVKKEFCYWEAENRATKKTKVPLKPYDNSKKNPVNVNGIMSPVLALGNGYYPPNDTNPDTGLNHAYDGDIASLFEGEHEFYVLTSHDMTDNEKIRYCGPNGEHADTFITNLKESDNIFYWIYAVRKDAKMAKTFSAARLAAQAPSKLAVAKQIIAGTQIKRERETPPVSEEGEEEHKNARVEN